MESRVPDGQLAPRFDAVERAIERHRKAPSRAPLSGAQTQAFDELQAFIEARGPQWSLDAGCGTGVSTHRLARRLAAPVVGIDRSAARLQRGSRQPQEHSELALCLRADLPAILKQMRRARRSSSCTYLLYPNPNPKSVHFGRRWHAHACFDDLLATCCGLELRTNWSVYAEEFAHALRYRLERRCEVETFEPEREALTPFEDKYHQSGHTLFRVRIASESESPLVETRTDDPTD